ncbi:MAG: GNAT family N-acetyltransferase, partial [Bdellovibrionota bacterium]
SQPEELGILWWAQRKNDGGVWIYDVEIHEKFRRRGYAHSALLELEKWGRIHACPHIGLNVFTYNYGAENFTESLVS